MAGTRTKRQHFVPRFYLEHFTDADGFVWAYDKQESSVRADVPEATATETNFYSVKSESGEYDDSIEDWLSKIESDAAPLYPKLLRGDALVGDERAKFALFIASTYTRSPAMVNAVASAHGDLAQITSDMTVGDRASLEKILDEAETTAGAERSSDEVRDLLFKVWKEKQYVMAVDKHVGLMTIDLAHHVADMMFSMQWFVYGNPDHRFITSDNPVVRITPTEFVDRLYGDGGFLHKHMYITTPLSPHRMVEMNWQKIGRTGLIKIDRNRVRELNRMRASFSERYLYSSVRDAGIASLAAKYARPGLRIDIGHPSERAPIELHRKLKGAG